MPQMNGYIGRSPGDSAVTKARQVFNVTSSTSTFTFTSGYDVGYFEVFINGVKQVVNNDYTAGNGSTFTLTSAAGNGDVIEAVAYKAFNLGTINNVTDDLAVGGDLTVGGVITGDGSGLTGVISGLELLQAGTSVGSAITAINFSGATVTAPSAGLSTVSINQSLTIGVRAGSAVTFSITNSTFNVSGRSGNVAIDV